MRWKIGRLCRPAAAAAACLAAACGAAGAAPSSEPGRPVATSTQRADLALACTAKRSGRGARSGTFGRPRFRLHRRGRQSQPVRALGIRFHSVDIDHSGVMSIDNGGAPGELLIMWHAALRIQKILRSAGYTADLTKSQANENVGL